MADRRSQIIHVHRDAPPKPAFGAACNGCGVCCAAETCPLGLIVFRRRRGPCPALEWHGETADGRYRCGLLVSPARYLRYLRWLPANAEGLVRRLGARWIAAGTSCDSQAEND
ncbi:MAG TPA: hypothetical protein VFY24_01035 [Azospira sp.]|nr:hypothetical protein [Azospira sp.]